VATFDCYYFLVAFNGHYTVNINDDDGKDYVDNDDEDYENDVVVDDEDDDYFGDFTNTE